MFKYEHLGASKKKPNQQKRNLQPLCKSALFLHCISVVGMRKSSLMQPLVIDCKLGKKFYRPLADSVSELLLGKSCCFCQRELRHAQYSWLDYFYLPVYFWNGQLGNGQTEHNCPVSRELNGCWCEGWGWRCGGSTRDTLRPPDSPHTPP